MSAVVDDLEKAAQGLDANTDSQADPELLRISKACQDLSGELLELLDKLQKKHGGMWHNIATTWAILRKQDAVRSMENRLDKYRSQIQLRLTFLIL